MVELLREAAFSTAEVKYTAGEIRSADLPKCTLQIDCSRYQAYCY